MSGCGWTWCIFLVYQLPATSYQLPATSYQLPAVSGQRLARGPFMVPPTPPGGVYQAKCCGMSECGWTWYIFRVLGRELSAARLRVKCEGPARTPGLAVFDCLLLNCNEWCKTQLYFGEKFDLVWMVDCGPVLHRSRGLTRFWSGDGDGIPCFGVFFGLDFCVGPSALCLSLPPRPRPAA